MAPPLVSVVVPVYNVDRYLDQCLTSIRSQTLADIEIICVDDGSTDDSAGILARHSAEDDRIIILTKPNSGYGDTMNRGLGLARGEYISVVESDDFIEATMLNRLADLARAYDAQAVKANYYHYWSSPERDELVRVVTPGSTGLVNPQKTRDIIYQPPSIWSGLYKRSFLQDNGISFLPTPGASYQDTSFAFKVWATASRAAFTEDAFVHYRQDNANSSINSLGKAYCVCAEFEEMARFVSSRPDLPPDTWAVLQLMRYNTYIWNYDRLDPVLREEFLTHIGQEFTRDRQKGVLDYSLFDPVRKACAEAIMASPKDFDESKTRSRDCAWAKFAHYWHIGGPKLFVNQALWNLVHRDKIVYAQQRES